MNEWMQMYKMTKQQEEQHTPAFVRMQQQAAAKEAEEAAEKKRIWEEEVASKKFWVNAFSTRKVTQAQAQAWGKHSLFACGFPLYKLIFQVLLFKLLENSLKIKLVFANRNLHAPGCNSQ